MTRNTIHNFLLLAVSIATTVGTAGVGLSAHLMQAEAISEDLAESLGQNEDVVRPHLERILRNGQLRRMVVLSAAPALMSVLLAIRLIADIQHDRKRQHMS